MLVLKNVNYNNILYYDTYIPEGVTTFICGESGSGKSTLLKLLNGVLSPLSGEIMYFNKSLEDYDPIQLRREILLVSQSVYLFDKSIKDNFAEYYAYLGATAINEEKIKRYLDICAVSLPLDSMCNVLSGGERQRVFVAINLSYNPKVLMLDEPTSALDDKTANILMENIISYCKASNITPVIISHDQAMSQKYADNIITLSGGAR